MVIKYGYSGEGEHPGDWSFEDRLSPMLGTSGAGTVDLRDYSSPRHNQKGSNSCVAQGVIKALEIKRILTYGKSKHIDLSVLALYYLARELRGGPDGGRVDNGTTISAACDALKRFGVCEDVVWPFDLSKVSVAPSWAAMRRAYVNKIDSYYRIRGIGSYRVDACIKALRNNCPVVVGTLIGNNWDGYGKKPDMVIGKPSTTEGGHITVLVGWDGTNFIGENSWGTKWGYDGYYFMDPDVIADFTLTDDPFVVSAPWDPFALGNKK